MSSNITPSHCPTPKYRGRLRHTLVTLLLSGIVAWHASMFFGLWHVISEGHSDFVAFYSAGKTLRKGLGPELYNQRTLTELQKQFAPQLVENHPGPLPYTHPPFEAALFAPLAAMSYPAAFAAWDIISAMALIASVVLLRPSVAHLRRWSGALPFLCAFAFFPILVCFLNGQDCTLILLFFVAAFVAIKYRHEFLAGASFGLALIKFQYVVPILAIFLLRRRWTLLAGTAVTAALLMAASAWATGWNATLGYPHALLVFSQSSPDLTVSTNMPNLRSIVESLIGHGAAASGVLALISVALILFVARACSLDPGRPAFDLEFSLAATVSLLVSYHLWAHDLTLLLLPLLLIGNALLQDAISHPARGLLIAVVVLLCFSPLSVLLASIHVLVAASFWLMVLLAVGIALELFQRRAAMRMQKATLN